MSRRRSTSLAATAAVAVLLLGATAYAAALLSRSPCLGIADNGDFHRVTRPAGIEPVEVPRRLGRFVQCEYVEVPADFEEYFSSAALAAWAAKHLPGGAPAGRMDLRAMGWLWLALVVLLLMAALRAGLPAVVALGVAVVLVDPGYLLFWNSFYADAATLVAVAGAVVWLRLWGPRILSGRPPGLGWCGVLLALAFVGGASKMQHVLLPGVLALALSPLLLIGRFGAAPGPEPATTGDGQRPSSGRAGPTLAVLVGALLLLQAATAHHFFAGSGPRFPEVNNYHAVFAGIAKASAEPDRALDALGVPPDLRALPRRDVFSGRIGLDHPVHTELADLSRLELLGLYLREPAAAGFVLDRVEEELALARSHKRGTYPRTEEHPRMEAYDPFWRFGRLRASLVALWPPVVWLVLAAAAASATAALVRPVRGGGPAGGRAAPYLFLVLWIGSQIAVTVLGDGFVAFEQHLLAARFAFDLLLALAAADGLLALARRRAQSPTGTRSNTLR